MPRDWRTRWMCPKGHYNFITKKRRADKVYKCKYCSTPIECVSDGRKISKLQRLIDCYEVRSPTSDTSEPDDSDPFLDLNISLVPTPQAIYPPRQPFCPADVHSPAYYNNRPLPPFSLFLTPRNEASGFQIYLDPRTGALSVGAENVPQNISEDAIQKPEPNSNSGPSGTSDESSRARQSSTGAIPKYGTRRPQNSSAGQAAFNNQIGSAYQGTPSSSECPHPSDANSLNIPLVVDSSSPFCYLPRWSSNDGTETRPIPPVFHPDFIGNNSIPANSFGGPIGSFHGTPFPQNQAGVVADNHTRPIASTSYNSRHSNDDRCTAATAQLNNSRDASQNTDRNHNRGNMARIRYRTNAPVDRRIRTGDGKSTAKKPVYFKDLAYLLELDEGDFVESIFENMSQINDCLKKWVLTGDTFVVLLMVLKKMFATRFPASQEVLARAIFTSRFIQQLQSYLSDLPMHDLDEKKMNSYFWTDVNEFWNMLIGVCRKVLELKHNFLTIYVQVVVSSLETCFCEFEKHQRQYIPSEIKGNLKVLLGDLRVAQLQLRRGSSVAAGVDEDAGQDRRDNFRAISIYPGLKEILTNRTSVAPNTIYGPYRNVDHYLDVQYRLLREDFISPLRLAIRAIQSGSEHYEIKYVRVYERIRFLRQETINKSYCIRIKFNLNDDQSLNFDDANCTEGLFGTLLCFTDDNFSTMKFARIIKADMDDLDKGELVVGFELPKPHLRFDHDYMMIECKIFFEPYFHVLRALQNIYEDDIAMKDYIIHVCPSNSFPHYLASHMVYKIDKREYVISNLSALRTNFYGLNDSQMKAFLAALTNELTIIQGPPGTGKTFLGLKIAKTLLDNYDSWWESTPMLVICYTNRALDQFLEGLVDTNTEIVRVGFQSKSEILKIFNLADLRKRASGGQGHKLPVEIQRTQRALASFTAAVDTIEQYDGIISFASLSEADPGHDEMYFSRATPEYFTDWLLEGYQEEDFEEAGGFANMQNENINRPDNAESLHVHDNDFINIYADDNVNVTPIPNWSELLVEEMKIPACSNTLTLASMAKQIDELNSLHDSMENNQNVRDDNESIAIGNAPQVDDVVLKLENQYQYLERKLEAVKNGMYNRKINTDIKIENPSAIRFDDRWALYSFWLDIYKQYLEQWVAALMRDLHGLHKQHDEIQGVMDTRILREKRIVGMTTTTAARLRSVLEGICSPIVIVEEAAEVLEAHIISALTKHCKHLILIGDHKQLKPATADYRISHALNLGVSLFERMINNGMRYHTLNIQHRMRPEISLLISPNIYQGLRSHKSVFNRPSIVGMDSCIRFIDHTNWEDNCAASLSKINLHEVEFAVALAKHLVLNGYDPKRITILTPYLGQVYAMVKERKCMGSIIENVQIVALDNYQGEENDIIILSLVRSNNRNRIGFLSCKNRVCVALSRARNGLYIFGNMQLLCSQSRLWKKIRKSLQSQDAIGTDLCLRCKIHKNSTMSVSTGNDFLRLPHGGCHRTCGAILKCNHVCQLQCHLQDRDHKKYKCEQRCNRRTCNHVCKKMCYEECGPCQYKVWRKFSCGHDSVLKCGVDPATYECRARCRIKIDGSGYLWIRDRLVRGLSVHVEKKELYSGKLVVACNQVIY